MAERSIIGSHVDDFYFWGNKRLEEGMKRRRNGIGSKEESSSEQSQVYWKDLVALKEMVGSGQM